jgi:hypothetical protein
MQGKSRKRQLRGSTQEEGPAVTGSCRPPSTRDTSKKLNWQQQQQQQQQLGLIALLPLLLLLRGVGYTKQLAGQQPRGLLAR